jgi:histidine triad (HIT) family protein
MTECDVCNILKSKGSFKFIYEDEDCFSILHESPAIAGHALVIPKKHVPIIEELDDKTVEHLFIVANKVSSALFDSTGAHGTNILINNGIDAGQELPHIVIQVLPRQEKDGLNLEWQPKKASDAELKSIKNRLQLYSDPIFLGKDTLPDIKVIHDEHSGGSASHKASAHDSSSPQPRIHEAHGHSHHEEPEKTEEIDYMLKALKRMP